MKGLFTKLVAGVSAVAVVTCACIPAMAQSEMDNMVFAGYDTTNVYTPNKIYNEVIGGHYTSKQVLVPVEPEWRAEGYEGVYPYAGYSRMYLEGNRQDITAYNQLFPQWETRFQDYFWEIKAPYRIWERQQTKVNNKTWKWDFGNEYFGIPDSCVKNRTNRYATLVKTEMKDYGFGRYNMCGEPLTVEELKMYSDFYMTQDYSKYYMSDAVTIWNNLVEGLLSPESLSATDENNRYVVTDEQIAAAIPVVQSKYITAKFNKKDNEGLATKSVAAEYLEHMNDGWDWDYDTSFEIVNNAKISWTKPYYELAEPYRYYQFLVVNGVVMDGMDGKDYIYRYTGGNASPKVEWKVCQFDHPRDAQGNEITNIYMVVEQKYVDGVPGLDLNGNYIYRYPTGEYGNTYFKKVGDIIEYRVVDRNGNDYLLAKAENTTGNVGAVDSLTAELVQYVDAYSRASERYNVNLWNK